MHAAKSTYNRALRSRSPGHGRVLAVTAEFWKWVTVGLGCSVGFGDVSQNLCLGAGLRLNALVFGHTLVGPPWARRSKFNG